MPPVIFFRGHFGVWARPATGAAGARGYKRNAVVFRAVVRPLQTYHVSIRDGTEETSFVTFVPYSCGPVRFSGVGSIFELRGFTAAAGHLTGRRPGKPWFRDRDWQVWLASE